MRTIVRFFSYCRYISGISAIQPVKFRNHRIRYSHAIRELIRFASSHRTTMLLMPERIRLYSTQSSFPNLCNTIGKLVSKHCPHIYGLRQRSK